MALTRRWHDDSAKTMIVNVLRHAFAAGQENMRKHLAEHFHYVSDQEPDNIYAKLSKVVAEFIEEFKIPKGSK